MADDAGALLDGLVRDPIASRRGPSVRDFGKKAERGLRGVIKRFEALVKLRAPASYAFLVETLRGHPSQMLGAALESAMIASGAPALLEAVAAPLDPAVEPHHPPNWSSICRAAMELGPRAFELLAPRLAFDAEREPRGTEIARACLVVQDDALSPPSDPRFIDVWLDALHEGDDALVATAASLLGKIGERSAAPRVLELLERDGVAVDAIAGALAAIGDETMLPVIRAEAARRKSAERAAAKALEKLARNLERREPSVPKPRTLAVYGTGKEIPTDDRFPLASLLGDGNVLVNGAMRCQVRLRKAGVLVLPTGAIAACDPLASATAVAFTHTLAPGRYPVVLSVLAFETEGDDVVAAATVRVRDRPIARWEVADPATYTVSHARGAFVDAGALGTLSALVGSAATRVGESRRGSLVLDRTTGANLISFPAGGGDGEYATFVGVDESGAIACITTSFDVVRTGT